MTESETVNPHNTPRVAARPLTFLDFFAGSGLVTEALRGTFAAIWANDIDPKKAEVYAANHGKQHFVAGSVEAVQGIDLPEADLAWASFPCQDLSLAGPMTGIEGQRSSLVWEWLRIVGEMPVKPGVVVAENVTGLVSAEGGRHYRLLHRELLALGYKSGVVQIDAKHWVPQSRPRVFMVSVPAEADVGMFSSPKPCWAHSKAIQQAAQGLRHNVWWTLPAPPKLTRSLLSVLDLEAECDDEKTARANLALISPEHRARLMGMLSNGFVAAAGYKRTRAAGQVLELRFDGMAGCLRTPKGGSSRQHLVIRKPDGTLATRLLTVREAARLMGVRDSYKLPGSYNDGYRAMGDAVAVPAVRYLARELLRPLATALRRPPKRD